MTNYSTSSTGKQPEHQLSDIPLCLVEKFSVTEPVKVVNNDFIVLTADFCSGWLEESLRIQCVLSNNSLGVSKIAGFKSFIKSKT